jgi:hypothetical protein
VFDLIADGLSNKEIARRGVRAERRQVGIRGVLI